MVDVTLDLTLTLKVVKVELPVVMVARHLVVLQMLQEIGPRQVLTHHPITTKLSGITTTRRSPFHETFYGATWSIVTEKR